MMGFFRWHSCSLRYTPPGGIKFLGAQVQDMMTAVSAFVGGKQGHEMIRRYRKNEKNNSDITLIKDERIVPTVVILPVTFLPIVERQLRESSRRPATYRM